MKIAACNLGIITYDTPHLKTEQLLHQLLVAQLTYSSVTVYALPFRSRAKRDTLFAHRPDQSQAVAAKDICAAHGFRCVTCNSDLDIDNACDLYLIGGAGILSPSCVANKKILNCHPGIIPLSRGLDAFKWAIYQMLPVGNTLHYINKEVDAGEILSVIETPLYEDDTLQTFARRHYENEISMLANFNIFLHNPVNHFLHAPVYDTHRRMDLITERKMLEVFDEYKQQYCAIPAVPSGCTLLDMLAEYKTRRNFCANLLKNANPIALDLSILFQVIFLYRGTLYCCPCVAKVGV